MGTRFRLEFDPEVALKQLRKDKDLKRVIKKVGDFKLALRPNHSPFEALAESIVYQQLNGKVAATIWGRFKGLFESEHLRPEDVLASSVELLRSAGLSAAKAAAMMDLSEKTQMGLVPNWAGLRKLDDEEIITRMTDVRGLGRWTVEMLLIFRLAAPTSGLWTTLPFARPTAMSSASRK